MWLGIDRPKFELRGKSPIRHAKLERHTFLIFSFKGRPSQEEHQTILLRFMIFSLILPYQNDLKRGF